MTTSKTVNQVKDGGTASAGSSVTSDSIDISTAVGAAVTASFTFNASATDGAAVEVLTSPDDTVWDTIAYSNTYVSWESGAVQISAAFNAAVKYVKVRLTNYDASYSITNVDIYITAMTL